MADLIAAFERASLARARKPLFHNMRMNYPVRDIMPIGAMAHLNPPENIDYREQPRKHKYLLLTSTLDFDYRFAAKTAFYSAAAIAPPGSSVVPNDLVKLVEDLQNVAGESELDIASYKRHSDLAVVMHLRLRTLFESGEHMEWHFYYDDDQFQTFHDLADEYEWLGLMLDLVNRASDRAFLHVERNIEASNPELAQTLAASRNRRWNTKLVPSANELLMRRLKHVQEHGTILLSDLDRENWTHHSHESLQVLLPCGHQDSVSYKQLKALNPEQCLQLTCAECKEQILTESDEALLSIAEEKMIREAFKRQSLYWDALDNPQSRNPNMKLRIKTSEFANALVEALESLRAPESAMPACINPVNFPETAAAMAGIREMLRVSGTEVPASADEMLEATSAEAMKAIAQYAGSEDPFATRLQQDYIAFLGRWLTRAVNCVVKASTPAAKGSVEEVELLMRGAQMEE